MLYCSNCWTWSISNWVGNRQVTKKRVWDEVGPRGGVDRWVAGAMNVLPAAEQNCLVPKEANKTWMTGSPFREEEVGVGKWVGLGELATSEPLWSLDLFAFKQSEQEQRTVILFMFKTAPVYIQTQVTKIKTAGIYSQFQKLYLHSFGWKSSAILIWVQTLNKYLYNHL